MNDVKKNIYINVLTSESKIAIALSLIIGVLGVASAVIALLRNQITEDITPVLEKTNFFEAFNHIFLNNLFLSLGVIIAGFLFYWLATVITLLNLFIFSYSLTTNLINSGIKDTFLKYLHSIIEVPAIILTLGISYRISSILIDALRDKKDKRYKEIIINLLLNIVVVVILLFLGAVIEAAFIKFNLF
ncbi:stage II sporulation protein M [Carnobacterium maltaromaticum]|uniref:stage II sporulation protein M n=1 Tax=Carnobacterium maltaromaticum TaxID=2751 RepID=UPI001DDFB688|nr:stage II sporulation protein M [Carnobacterium maltaromaticum]MCC4311212.1 hypothetical protein [Carnobacterium maltaromaticum]